MKRSLATAGFAAALALAASATIVMSGCASGAGNATNAESESTAAVATSSGTAVQSADAAAQTPTMDFGKGLDENGFWEGVTASDYVTLCDDYASIVIPASVVDVDEAVQSQIDSFVQAHTQTNQVTDRAVADGDTVNIDYVGSVDGVEFEGGNTQGNGTTVVIGTTQYIDDFLQQVIGHKPGETFDVNVTFPEEYGVENLNGKDAVFKVTVNYIEEKVVPEVTDAWVAEHLGPTYGWTTVDAMKEELTASLIKDAKMRYVQDYIVENSTVTEIPQSLVEYQERFLVYQFENYASSYGFTFENFINMMYGISTADELVERNREAIQTTAKGYLVFQAIAEKEGIKISDEDATEYLRQMMGLDSVDGYVEMYGMPYLKLNTVADTVVARCADSATVADEK